MAKKKKEEVIEEPLVEDTVVVEESIEEFEEPKPVFNRPENPNVDGWEIKDRMYYLKGKNKPISRALKACNIYWFDESKGYQRELKYCTNQITPFVDEMKGDHRLSSIIFRSGALFVPKEETVLQKLLSLYHPHRDQIYYEHKPQALAEAQIDRLEIEADAIIAARGCGIDLAEAIVRTDIGSKVNQMSSKEIKRDLLVFARKRPMLFLNLLNDDNVVLRDMGIKATEAGIIKLSSDNRTFMWGSNKRKLFTVPFDEHPYSALAAWFKTDEGMDIYSQIEKRLN